MDGLDGSVRVLLVYEDGDLDLARGDHIYVDLPRGEGVEHLGGDAAREHHARSDDADLGDVLIHVEAGKAELVDMRLKNVAGEIGVRPRDGEGYVLDPVSAETLKDDIDVDILFCEASERPERHTGYILHTDKGYTRYVNVLCHSADFSLFQFIYPPDFCSGQSLIA